MERVARLLKIRPDERRVAVRLLAMMVVVWSGFALGGNAVESLFFVRFGPDFLPYLFVALGGATFAVVLGLNALLARASPRRVLVGAPLAMAGAVLAMRALLALPWRWLYPAMWLAMMVMWTVEAVASWGVAAEVHDTRQAKRLFPLYGSGLILGWAVGGLATGPLARWLGAENLLLLWSGALVVSWSLARSALRVSGVGAERRRRPGRAVSAWAELADGLRSVRASPLLSSMASSRALLAILYFLLSFVFARTATARFPEADRLAGFLGLFMGVMSGLGLLASLFLANRLFGRFGVATMVLVLSVVYVAGFGGLSVSMTFGSVVAFRLVQMVWFNGVWNTAWQALFNVVPPERRERTRAFVEGVALQLGTAAAGLVLIAARPVLDSRAFSAIGLAVAGVATLTAWRVHRSYAGAVVEALRAGNPEVFVADEEPFGGMRRDAAAMAAVTRAAADPDPSVRRISVEVLADVADREAIPLLLQSLRDEDPVVRAAALRGVGRAGGTAPADLTRLLSDPDAGVRLAAVEALVATGSAEDVPVGLRPRLNDPDPRVRARAAVALLGTAADRPARRALEAMAGSPAPEWRTAAVAASAGTDATIVTSGLADPDPMVRRAAVSAVSASPPPAAIERLVETLGDSDPDVRSAAVEALVRAADRARQPLLEALGRPDLEAGAMHVLARLEGVDPSILRAYIRREMSVAVRYAGLLRRIEADPDDRMGLLAHSLRSGSAEHAVNALHAASRFWEPVAIRLAIENLGSRDPGQRANALETLEAVGEPDVVRPLLTAWEATGASGADGGPVLTELMGDQDPWMRACAAFASAGHREVRPSVELLSRTDADTLVRESATAALEGDRSVQTLPSLSLMEKIVYLRRVPLFADLSPADLKHVAEIASEHLYPDGEVIGEQGDPGDEMYLVVSGEIRVLVRRGQEPAAEVARRVAGDSVGEMAVISQVPRMAALVAAGDARVLAIDQRRFERILRDRPEASLAVMRVLCNRLRESTGAEPPEARG